jgi:hypothetical protein
MTEKTNKAMPSPASGRKPHPDFETKDGIPMTPLKYREAGGIESEWTHTANLGRWFRVARKKGGD